MPLTSTEIVRQGLAARVARPFANTETCGPDEETVISPCDAQAEKMDWQHPEHCRSAGVITDADTTGL